MTQAYVVDTNILLSNPSILEQGDIIIHSVVLQEIESLERKKDYRQLQFQVRQAKRAIKEALEKGLAFIEDSSNTDSLSVQGDPTYADNIILDFAYKRGFGVLTNDLLLQFKAAALGVPYQDGKPKEADPYDGYQVMELSEKDTNSLIFQNLEANVFSLKTNEYLILTYPNTEKVHTVVKWIENHYETVAIEKSFRSKNSLGEVKPRDVYQKIAVESIRNNQVTMLRGRPGTGKTLIALNEAWNLVEKGDYKLRVFFNPTPAKDAIEMGFYTGDVIEKALQSSVGTMLKSKFGDADTIRDHIALGKMELHPFVDLRGLDTGGEKPSVVFISEAQNLTSELLKLGLQRVDEESIVIIDGDFDQQVDKEVYANNNGMQRASEVLRGSHLYGEVKLVNVYRSELADIVDQM